MRESTKRNRASAFQKWDKEMHGGFGGSGEEEGLLGNRTLGSRRAGESNAVFFHSSLSPPLYLSPLFLQFPGRQASLESGSSEAPNIYQGLKATCG